MNEDANTKTRPRSIRRAGNLLILAGAAVAIATVAGFAGTVWWRFELACHFRVQYIVSLAVIALALALLRRWRFAAVFVAFCMLNLAVVLPLWAFAPEEPATVPVRAMLMNVLTSNRDSDSVRAAIEDYNPDFIVLLETDKWWLTELDAIRHTYPYMITRPRPDNFGITFLSKVEPANLEIVDVAVTDVPAVLAKIEFDGRPFAILGMHAFPPVHGSVALRRNKQFADTAAFVRRLKMPVLLLGDLNTTPWSPYFTRLLDESGLYDSSAGYGYQPTWPTSNPLLWIPIDHCLYSNGIGIASREVGPDVGSDHFPVIVDFTLR